MRYRRNRWLFIFLGLALWLGLGSAAYSQSNEYLLKAGFLEKFAKFCEWPELDQADFFTIVVFGSDPFEGLLDQMYQNRQIKELSVQVKYVEKIENIPECQLLFISESKINEVEELLGILSEKPVLTVGESNGLCQKGTIFNFYFTAKGTIHFELNFKGLSKSGIKMDPLLMNYAKNCNH